VVLALTLGALVALPGCGGGSKGHPIPAADANRMIKLIQTADQESQGGTCRGADAKAKEAQRALDGVPRSVDAGVRQGIADGLTRLRALIASECQRPQTTTDTTPTVTQTTTSQTTPSATQTTPSDTQSTPTDTSTGTGTSTTPTATQTTPTSTGNGGIGTGTGGQGTGQ
jgi:hypothetical protein